MPIRQGARGLIGSQVFSQPLHLGRAGVVVDLAIEDNNVPIAQIIGVVALAAPGTVVIQG